MGNKKANFREAVPASEAGCTAVIYPSSFPPDPRPFVLITAVSLGTQVFH